MLRASCVVPNRRPSRRKLRLPISRSVAGLRRGSNDSSVSRAVVTCETFLSQLHCDVTVEGVRNQDRNERGAYRASRRIVRSPIFTVLIPNDNSKPSDIASHLPCVGSTAANSPCCIERPSLCRFSFETAF